MYINLADLRKACLRLVALALCLGLAPQVRGQAFSPQTTAALDLGRLWTRSLAAEQRQHFDDALAQVAAFRSQGGDAYLAAVRTGWLLTLKQDFPAAADAYRQAADRDGQALTPLLGLLSCQEHLADATGDVQTAEAILRLDPANYVANMAIGRARFAEQQYTRALPFLAAVVQRYPEDAEATSHLAWTLFYLGRKAEAVPHFRRLVAMQPDFPHAARGLELTTAEVPPPATSGGPLPEVAGAQKP